MLDKRNYPEWIPLYYNYRYQGRGIDACLFLNTIKFTVCIRVV